jgi:predicted HicB family RNase H-like nuclease
MGRRNEKKQTMAAMHVLVRPSVKAMAVRLAQEDNRSLAKWLERLIEAEAARLDGKK